MLRHTVNKLTWMMLASGVFLLQGCYTQLAIPESSDEGYGGYRVEERGYQTSRQEDAAEVYDDSLDAPVTYLNGDSVYYTDEDPDLVVEKYYFYDDDPFDHTSPRYLNDPDYYVNVYVNDYPTNYNRHHRYYSRYGYYSNWYDPWDPWYVDIYYDPWWPVNYGWRCYNPYYTVIYDPWWGYYPRYPYYGHYGYRGRGYGYGYGYTHVNKGRDYQRRDWGRRLPSGTSTSGRPGITRTGSGSSGSSGTGVSAP
ncbi:MAG TPA: hypothetical protein PLG66_04870, partial [Calditrichia bacterium]|nr:hypothetical protein [Calditrichia bacterium]